jgi:hypothetical protein
MATKGQKLVLAGSTILVAEPVLALLHTGGVGVIVGLVAGAVAYHAVEDIEEMTGKEMTLPVQRKGTHEGRRASALYRMLNGKSLREEDMPTDEEIAAHAQKYDLDLPKGEEEKQAAPPPKVYRYDDIKHLIPANRALLGVHPDTGKLELTTWSKLKILWIVGTSSTGKSNTAYGKALEAVDDGAKLLVVDQHMHKPDSLGRKLLAFESAFLRPIAVTDSEVLATLDAFEEEFERRVAGARVSQKIVLICDEMGRMARNEKLLKRLKEIVAICGEEARGFGMYGWFLSQKAVGLKWLRDAALTVMVHRMVRIEEARLACNDNLAAARANLKYPIGRTYIYGVDFDEVELQQALYTTEEEDHQEDEEDWDEEGVDDLLTALHLRKKQAHPEKLDTATLVALLKLGRLDEAAFFALIGEMFNGNEGKAPRVVEADLQQGMDVAALRALPYQEYLKTDHWQKERKGALKRAAYACQVCKRANVQLEVHHNTYERLGEELESDLLVLCEQCHGLFSERGKLAEKRGYEEEKPQPVQKKLPDDLQKALDVCKEKGIKGPRALHREMGGSYYEAQKLYAELVERGLIESD